MNDDVKQLADDEKGLRRWVITGETAKKIVDRKALLEALRGGPKEKFVSELQRYKSHVDELIGSVFVSVHIETKHFPLTGEILVNEVLPDGHKRDGVTLTLQGEPARQIADMYRQHFDLERQIKLLKAKLDDQAKAISEAAKSAASGGTIDFSYSLDPGRFDENGTIIVREIEDKPAGALAGLLRALAA